ncbi:hypothetical protein ATCV1_z130R [Acanthocystis turfacea chlorella virus 1]|uniref:Uncharacterized protein z130R n=1 Tax=Chlorovirus heliozoae TaxID=322019 RepID=A7K890_9PHYC|nr:hypothetical protein ATCV1_z130R [Acanthocystis turfacea chlorella virus 1]ABT16264.1 hypothetical protein ATCV1_z130R [Acanthocystis turfacea chlorella virus 1]
MKRDGERARTLLPMAGAIFFPLGPRTTRPPRGPLKMMRPRASFFPIGVYLDLGGIDIHYTNIFIQALVFLSSSFFSTLTKVALLVLVMVTGLPAIVTVLGVASLTMVPL